MTFTPSNGSVSKIAEDASVRALLAPIKDIMETEGVTEICINKSGLIHFERYSRWETKEVPAMDFARCMSLGTAIATMTQQKIGGETTILSATLRSGERTHIVIPPTTPPDTVSVTIRIPSAATRSMEEYDKQGFFKEIDDGAKGISEIDRKLLELKQAKNYKDFLLGCVHHRKNIAIVGDTGSGKTTFMKALCQEIDPSERLITIEDSRELFLDKHSNKVHLVYSMDGKAKATPAVLIKSTLRMKPDRVLPAELRGEEAFDFVDLLTTGHNGSITSFHAESCGVAFERFSLMCKKHPNAASYTHSELMRLLHMTVDVIAHVERKGQQRFISEIYFDPEKKFKLKHG